MGYSSPEHKNKIKMVMKDFIAEAGSAFTLSDIRNEVTEQLTGSPSFTTIQTYLKEFESGEFGAKFVKEKVIESFSKDITLWEPVGRNKPKLRKIKSFTV